MGAEHCKSNNFVRVYDSRVIFHSVGAYPGNMTDGVAAEVYGVCWASDSIARVLEACL